MEMKLQQGDILLFKTKDESWLNRCISILTNSDTCHAAMVYADDTLIELIAPGVCINKMEAAEGDDVYVMRLKHMINAGPLIRMADTYVHSKTRFDFPALAILGGLLLYRNIHPNKEILSLGSKIFLLACRELDQLIQKVLLKNPDGAMVCSQFIYQIFYESGEDYKIQIKGGILWSDEDNCPANGSIRIVDLISNSAEDESSSNLVHYIIEDSAEELAEQLHELLVEDENSSLRDPDIVNCNEIVEPAKRFVDRLNYLLKISKINMPLQSLFISAGDILNHGTNLDRLGTCSLHVTRHYK